MHQGRAGCASAGPQLSPKGQDTAVSPSPPDTPPRPPAGREPPHDPVETIIQTLFAAQLIADALPSASERSQSLAEEGFEELQRLIKTALSEAYRLHRELRPPVPNALRRPEPRREPVADRAEDGRPAPAEAA